MEAALHNRARAERNGRMVKKSMFTQSRRGMERRKGRYCQNNIHRVVF